MLSETGTRGNAEGTKAAQEIVAAPVAAVSAREMAAAPKAKPLEIPGGAEGGETHREVGHTVRIQSCPADIERSPTTEGFCPAAATEGSGGRQPTELATLYGERGLGRRDENAERASNERKRGKTTAAQEIVTAPIVAASARETAAAPEAKPVEIPGGAEGGETHREVGHTARIQSCPADIEWSPTTVGFFPAAATEGSGGRQPTEPTILYGERGLGRYGDKRPT
ncbi:hypothetical protein NDU88_005821 [Pleurodeles waltl]|uniref:Uncharacterized protein n=1 Tax=Pleurodeles waltl TaxID=8319 RepID=A0AAV7UJ85_PLEWA|nr:hypothetical protein NDU88_005821 [Pleurodeles waltl]